MFPKVLIIGGGLSGLALAQCLRKAEIDCEIYERDVDNSARSQGWAITLRECLAGIYKLFPTDLPALEENVSVFRNLSSQSPGMQRLKDSSQRASFGGVHYQTGEVLELITSTGKDEDLKHHRIRANREVFRAWLTNGLVVHWGKQFIRYEETDNGVRAFFSDGTVAEGDILIASDGAHSRCRQQLLGAEGARPQQATVGAITANITVGEAEYRDLFEKGAEFLTATSPEYHFFMGPRAFSATSRSAEYYWSVTWDDKDHTGAGDSKALQPWEVDGETARHYALQLCHDLHPTLRRYIENTSADQIANSSPQLLQWSPDLDRLPGKRITLMGDAAHTMVPFRGAGANTALLDAFDIAQLLMQARTAGRDFADVLEPYEKIAIPRGRGMMQFSRSVGMAPDPTHWARTMKKVFSHGYEWNELPQTL